MIDTKTCGGCKYSERYDNPDGDGLCHNLRIAVLQIREGKTPHEVHGVLLSLPHNCQFFNKR